MNVMVDLCVVPIGVGVSVSAYVAACERVISGAGLESQLHPYGTVIQGEWEAVMAAVKRCHEVVHEMGAPRVFTTLKIGTRTDREQTMNDKINSVVEKLEREN
ncbi:MAG: MTH1187 family thiamine-binding protein [Gammaproteobacteria bacterium]